MAEIVPEFPPRTPEQVRAADPERHVWVEASAGTGKTQVLTDRILRLLLAGARPERILAVTFTRAAAAEMVNRLMRTLARWRSAPDAAIRAELVAMGAPSSPEVVARARTLFGDVLDLPTGLAIETLHGFAQGLLAAFPLEAGLSPGFTAMDERDAEQMKRRTLAEEIAAAQRESGSRFLSDLGELALVGGDEGLQKLVAALLDAEEGFAAFRSAEGIGALVERVVGAAADADAEKILRDGLAPERFDEGLLEAMASDFEHWGAKSGLERAADIRTWLALDPEVRVARYRDLLRPVFLTKEGGIRKPTKKLLEMPGFPERLTEGGAQLLALEAEVVHVQTAARNAQALRVGHRLSDRYVRLKRGEGVIDYQDMILHAARLLGTPGMPDWVKYKLDQRFDHILVDEAQDTNEAQWQIIRNLVDDYFLPPADERQRTLFVVGDLKQSIYHFQGTEPEIFAGEGQRFAEKAARSGGHMEEVPLGRSFRSGPAVLEFVDAVLADMGPEALGLRHPVPDHVASRAEAPGEVVLWPLVEAPAGEGEDEEADSEDAEAAVAESIADEIAGWLRPGKDRLWLPAHGRHARPGDILILLRQRSKLMLRLVGELHRRRVRVAGVDRILLTEPLAVLDLVALMRFAVQPEDDLNLANLLVSPFLGWRDHEAIRRLSAGRGRTSLWQRLRESDSGPAEKATAYLREVLNLADRSTPYAFLDTVLSGPPGGRRKLLGRLGEESRQAIEELLNQALLFEEAHPPLLAGFLDWLTHDSFTVKREPDASRDEVRLMTIHGAKGLEAPVVILADTGKKKRPPAKSTITLDVPGTGALPFLVGKEPRPEAIGTALDKEQRIEDEETLRLLYVALTRAADHLFIGGAVAPGDVEKLDEEDKENRWHTRLKRVLSGMKGVEKIGAPRFFGEALRLRRGAWVPPRNDDSPAVAGDPATLPVFDRLEAGPAPPPAVLAPPLSPSRMPGEDGEGPALDDLAAAARRGRLIHRLFEKLPSLPEEKRRATGQAWLLSRGVAETEAGAMLDEVFAVMQADPWLFVADALAEAPVAGVVGSRVVTGIVDRLIVDDAQVVVADFKTGRRVPARPEDVPTGHLQQMALYVALLERALPGREVSAALLYTAGPRVHRLRSAWLRQFLPVESRADDARFRVE